MDKVTGSTAAPQSPLLTICMHGKDDDYMHDFKYRLGVTVNLLARNLSELDRLYQVEILVTDWGSQKPLSESVRLSREACQICRFIHVPPATVLSTQEDQDSYHTSRAANVGLRRARGRFAFITNCDQLMSVPAVEQLLRLLGKEMLRAEIDADGTFFAVPRMQIPWQMVQRQPTVDEWADFLLKNEHSLAREASVYQHCFGATSGFILATESYRAQRGLDEMHPGWGWNDIDFALRMTQERPFIWLSNLGIYMYHMGHPSTGRRVAAVRNSNRTVYSSTPTVNDADWGLGSFQFVESRQTYAETAYREAQESARSARKRALSESIPKAVAGLESETQDPELKNDIAEFRSRGWVVPVEQKAFVLLLHAVSRSMRPATYLEVGFLESFNTSILSKAIPCVSIFGVQQLKGEQAGNPLVTHLEFMTNSGFQGRFQYINARGTVAIERILSAAPLQKNFEMIVVPSDELILLEVPEIESLCSLLAPGGALLVRGSSEESFTSGWSRLVRGGRALIDRQFLIAGSFCGAVTRSEAAGISPEPIRSKIHETWFAAFPKEAAIGPRGAVRLLRKPYRLLRALARKGRDFLSPGRYPDRGNAPKVDRK